MKFRQQGPADEETAKKVQKNHDKKMKCSNTDLTTSSILADTKISINVKKRLHRKQIKILKTREIRVGEKGR
jgi:hypothetical protein